MSGLAVDNSGATSADLRKQIAEQTKALLDEVTSPVAAKGDVEVKIEEEAAEETETTEQAEEAEAEETKTSEEETSEKEETPKKKETLHKLKVEGKEEEWPLEKVLEFAQKGRFLEKEKQRLNEEKKRLEEDRGRFQTTQPTVDLEKAKEEFFSALQQNPFAALTMLQETWFQKKQQEEAQLKQQDRAFEKSRKETDPETWSILKPLYEQYREEGQTREMAYALAENDLLRQALTSAKEKGRKEGLEKEKAKQKAAIPSGQGKGKTRTGSTSLEEFRKLSAAELRKRLPRAGPREDW